MDQRNKLTGGQWLQWAGATLIAAVVMVVSVITWAESHIYSRKEGEQNRHDISRVETAHEKHEDKLDRQLSEMRRKIDKIYELMIERKSNLRIPEREAAFSHAAWPNSSLSQSDCK